MRKLIAGSLLASLLSFGAFAAEKTDTIKVSGWHCGGCAARTEAALKDSKEASSEPAMSFLIGSLSGCLTRQDGMDSSQSTGQAQGIARVGGRGAPKLVRRQAAQAGERCRRQRHVGWLVALSPVGDGCEKGAVRLHQDPIQRGPGSGVADRFRVLEREHAGEAQVQAEREVTLRRTPAAGEAVDDAAVWPQLCPQDLRRLHVGLAGVHDQRLSELPCQPDLPDEYRPLHVARGAIVVEIETAFPDGGH